jgi:hypothetical protein
VITAALDEPLHRRQAAGLDRGSDHPRRCGIDDDQQHLHIIRIAAAPLPAA